MRGVDQIEKLKLASLLSAFQAIENQIVVLGHFRKMVALAKAHVLDRPTLMDAFHVLAQTIDRTGDAV